MRAGPLKASTHSFQNRFCIAEGHCNDRPAFLQILAAAEVEQAAMQQGLKG
jgi:hypothetical protein